LLSDDSETPRYIETLPRIGYRFIGTISSAPAAAAAPRRLRWAVPVFAGLLVLVAAVGWWRAQQPRTLMGPVARVGEASSSGRSTNQRAYELYLSGKFERSRRDVNGTPAAIADLQAALREDPYFAEAWAALAETYIGAGLTQGMPIDEAIKQARTAALRAIGLDPELASAHASLASIRLHYDFDYAGVEKELAASRAVDDRYSRMWHTFGLLRGYQGRTDEAFQYLGRARELEPMTLLYTYSYASLLYQTRRYQEAIEYVRPLLASQPRFDQARGVLIRALVATGDVKAALEQLPLRYAEVPMLSDAGLVYAHAGRREDAQRELERLERRRLEGYGMSYEIAVLHVALGQIDKACTALRRAPDDHSQTLGWLRLDPRMDPLRKEACYTEVTRRLFGSD